MTPRITERERTAILGSLAAGVVPSIGLHLIQVGRKDEVNALLNDLRRIEDGGAALRFVVGRYGAGKSFFLNLIKTVALERKLVAVRADITTERRLHGTGGQARSLYSELMRNLATRSRPEGGALANLVERWIAGLAQEVKSAGGSDADIATRVQEACKPLQDHVSGYDFANVLAAYYRGFAEHNEVLQQAAVRWLRAEYTTKTEARQELGVRTVIGDDSFYEYLKLMGAFVRIAGYAGLLVCIDELVVLSHRLNNRVARNNNYEAILRILNDTLQGAVQGLGFLFAATDEALADKRRGLFSNEALATRLAPNRFVGDGLTDFGGPVVRLANLTPEDCFVLLHNVRRVHARGDESKYVLPDEGIVRYLEDCQRRMGAAYFQTPRDTVKDFVGLLSVLEQNPQARWEALLGQIATTAVPTQDRALADAKDDDDGSTQGSSDSEVTAPAGDDDDLASFKL
ncbi:MAG TPA: ATP-binding protein [Phycisphaerae bacterium]|nr:ATP-binding protein [Phycisphaerae bacterium]HNU45348.1 ATP-binding protein [Phycisphaerae bacterium]